MYNTIGNAGSEGNIGGFSSNWYWSSSENEYYTESAWFVRLNGYDHGTSANGRLKDNETLVRPIRAF